MSHFAKNLAATLMVATCASAGQAEAADLQQQVQDPQNFLDAEVAKKLDATYLSADELKEVKTAEETKSSLWYKYVNQELLGAILNRGLADGFTGFDESSDTFKAAKKGDLEALLALKAVRDGTFKQLPEAFNKKEQVKDADKTKEKLDKLKSDLAAAEMWALLVEIPEIASDFGASKTVKAHFEAEIKTRKADVDAQTKAFIDPISDDAKGASELKAARQKAAKEQKKAIERENKDSQSLFEEINGGVKDVPAFFAKVHNTFTHLPSARKQVLVLKANIEQLKIQLKVPTITAEEKTKLENDIKKMEASLKTWEAHVKYLESQVGSSGMSMMMWALIVLAILVVVGVLCFFIFKKDSNNQELPTHEGDLDSEEEEEEELTK